MGGIGVSLTYSILGFSNFAHGDIMALGAYFALGLLALFTSLGLPDTPFGPLSFGFTFTLSFALALVLTAFAVVVIDRILYKRLRHATHHPDEASIGVALGLRNVLQFCWGPQPHYYIEKIQLAIAVPGLGVRIKPDQVFIILVAVIVVTLVHYFLQHTRMGKAMRAAADNMELARVSGINTERVILWTWVIGGALAATAGILAGIENKLITGVGLADAFSVFAAVILGGLGNPYGAILGGMVIGVSEEASTAFIPTGYKPAVAFVIMILMLFIKPTGLLGRRR